MVWVVLSRFVTYSANFRGCVQATPQMPPHIYININNRTYNPGLKLQKRLIPTERLFLTAYPQRAAHVYDVLNDNYSKQGNK